MKTKIVRYAALAAVVLGGAVMAVPKTTHAYYSAIGTCAAGTSPAVLPFQVHVNGATNYALPVTQAAVAGSPPPATSSLTVTAPGGQALVTAAIASLYAATGITPTANLVSSVPVTSSATLAATSPSAQDYGYLTYVGGLTAPYQTPGPNNRTAALFTFSSTTSSVIDATGLPYASSAHVGTLTIYAATGQRGDFNQPASFMSGTPIVTATYTLTNSGTVPNPTAFLQSAAGMPGAGPSGTNTMNPAQQGIGQQYYSAGSATITGATAFSLDGTCYQLGTAGTTFTMQSVGHLASPTVSNGAFWGAWF